MAFTHTIPTGRRDRAPAHRRRPKIAAPVLAAALAAAVIGFTPGVGHADPGGTVMAEISDAHGAPLNGICLDVVNPGKKNSANDVVVSTAGSGADGTDGEITQAGVAPGTYIGYYYNCGALDGHVPVYYGGTLNKSKATQFTVTDGGTIDLGHQIVADAGAVSGTLLDSSQGGAPAVFAPVWAVTAKGNDVIVRGCTDTNGNFTLFNLPGEGVKLELAPKKGECFGQAGTYAQQWYGGTSYSTATVVPVTIGGVTTVDTTTLDLVQKPNHTIASVVFGGGSTSPTITVNGSGFGNKAPKPNPTDRPCNELDSPNTGYDYGNNVVLWDNGPIDQFQAGYPGDCIGIIIQSWSSTQVVFTFGQWYEDVQLGRQPLDQGDPFVIHVKGAVITGTVMYPGI